MATDTAKAGAKPKASSDTHVAKKAKLDKTPSEFCASRRSLGDELVTIVCGTEEFAIHVHKDRLCRVSVYFYKAFHGRFVEAREGVSRFEDIDMSLFEYFVEWLYTGDCSIPSDKKLSVKVKLDAMIDLYLFADRIRCHKLKNYIFECLQDFMYEPDGNLTKMVVLSSSQISNVFDNTINSADSPLRTFCAALVSHDGGIGAKYVDHYQDLFSRNDFLKEFFAYQRKARTQRSIRHENAGMIDADPRIRSEHIPLDNEGDGQTVGIPICFFHIHPKGEKCRTRSNHVCPDWD